MSNLITDPNGTQRWMVKGKLHRENGPSIVTKSGTQIWYQNGVRHPTDGPAVINPDGRKKWWAKDHLLDNNTIIFLTQKLSVSDAICCCLAYYLYITPYNVQDVTGWDPTTEPTEHHLNVWRMLAGLVE